MNFFSFAAEIRLKIYEELLVHSEPITFETTWDPSRPPLSLSKRYGLCPALLRVNKRVKCEANPLLYSGNRFKFSDLNPTPKLDPKKAVLASFLSQIERQNASFLRYVCIDFPAFDDYQSGSAKLKEDSIKTLELIRDNCTSLATLEISLRHTSRLEYVDYMFDKSPIISEALDLLDARLKAISSLKEVVVSVHDYERPGDDLKESGYSREEDEYVDYESYLEMKREQERGRGVGGGMSQEKTRSLLEEGF